MAILENTSVVVAVCAALVSALAALYARWQAQAAQRANDIAIHENRLAIYKGLGRFRSNVIAYGASFSEEELWRFDEVVQLSEFYFPPNIFEKMKVLFEQAMSVMNKHQEWDRLRKAGSEDAGVLAKPKQEAMRDLRDECFNVAKDIKHHLKVGHA